MRSALLDFFIAAAVFGVFACNTPLRHDVPAGDAGVMAVSMPAPSGVDTVVFARTTTRDGRDSSTGTRTVVLRTLHGPGGVRQLEVVQWFPGGGGTIVDTAIAGLPGLHAAAHRSHQPSKTMRFEFADSTAIGVVTSLAPAPDTGRRTENVRQQLGGPIYDSNIIELVIAALPLREGFTAELPFFIYERGGRVPMQVAVRARATSDFGASGSREAWVVSVGVPGAPATVWVDTRCVTRSRRGTSASLTTA
jgi:hypothetical protein